MGDFRDANLSNANLSETNFFGANLSKALLCKANLLSANFSETNLIDSNFEGSSMGWTIFANNDLSVVKGLEAVRHAGPSTIGVDTLYQSQGRIPEVFLRRAGLPDEFVTYMLSLAESVRPIQFYSCFISHSHADKVFAIRLYDALQEAGIRCWLDEHQILPGDKIYTEVDRGIRLWDKVLLCCSKAALTSWWVDNEIKIAFDKEQQLWQKHKREVLALIPLNLDGYLFKGEWKSGLATEVRARLAADFTDWESDETKFRGPFKRLVTALRTGSGGKETPPPSRF